MSLFLHSILSFYIIGILMINQLKRGSLVIIIKNTICESQPFHSAIHRLSRYASNCITGFANAFNSNYSFSSDVVGIIDGIELVTSSSG